MMTIYLYISALCLVIAAVFVVVVKALEAFENRFDTDFEPEIDFLPPDDEIKMPKPSARFTHDCID